MVGLAKASPNYSKITFDLPICTDPAHTLGECMALWGEPNEPSIQHQVYIFMQCVDS